MPKCIEWAEERVEECNEWRDEGHNECSDWDKCCDWWPCSWGCKLITWVCVGWYWVASWGMATSTNGGETWSYG